MTVKLIWATPDADNQLAYIARVSNPANQENPSIEGLLRYMMREGHVSPFEMVNACVEINTTRDIARQILRHRSFSFQEFSQRYQDASVLGEAVIGECRMQDAKNRQASTEADDAETIDWWQSAQESVAEITGTMYDNALKYGIAKEVARKLLPEGMTPSRMYMNGTLRSWVHYLGSRLHPSTQKEHRLVAGQILLALREVAPVTIGVFFPVTGDA